jgi:DNA-binding NarL/FixJ family response regulator
MNIRVLIADDHAVVADGLKALISAHDGLEVVACVSDGREAVRQAQNSNVDVAVLDISMPELNGIDAAARLRECSPNVKVVILSMHSNHEYVVRALQAGARGYVLKKVAGQEVVSAIRAVHGGKRFLSPEIAEDVVEHYLRERAPTHPLDSLSLRERQVLQLSAEGQSMATIAQALQLSPKTVETYRGRLMQKLGIKDLPGLIRFAIQQGMTPLE